MIRRTAVGVTTLMGLLVAAWPVHSQTHPLREVSAVLTLGTGQGSDDTFGRVIDVKLSGDNIVVLDNVGFAVRVFDANGRFLRRFGRKGQGPGEFVSPFRLVVTDTHVVVLERSGWRELRFTQDGRHVRTTAMGAQAWTRRRFPVRAGSTLVELTPEIIGWDPTPAHYWRHVALERRGRRQLDTLFRIRSDTTFRRRQGDDIVSHTTSAFGPGGAWAISGDSLVAHADGYTGTVIWYAFGENGAMQVRRDTLGRAGSPITAADVDAEAARQLIVSPASFRARGSAVTSSSSAPWDILAPPTHRSIATQALFSPDGTLWVGNPRFISDRERGPHPPWIWTAFPAAGAAFAVHLPAAFTLTAVKGDRLYGYSESADGEPVVVVYAVNR